MALSNHHDYMSDVAPGAQDDDFLEPQRGIMRYDATMGPYRPPNCIQLPPEIIYMIAAMAPSKFALTSHEYYNEFKELAKQHWMHLQPLTFWFTRNADVAIPVASLPASALDLLNWSRFMGAASLRYAT